MIERDQQLLLPVRPSYIVGTLLAALMLNLLPFGRAPWAPDFLLVTVALWCLYQPARVGVGVAFCLGLVMDVHATTLLGIHALAYSVMANVDFDGQQSLNPEQNNRLREILQAFKG